MGLSEKGDGRPASPGTPGAIFLTQLGFSDWDHTAPVAAKRAAFLCTWTSLISDAPLEAGLFPNSPGTISFPPCREKGRQPHTKREREREAIYLSIYLPVAPTDLAKGKIKERKEDLSFFRTLNPGAKAKTITMMRAHIY